MGRRSKKSKASRKPARQKKSYSTLENIIYYALAVIGVLVLVSVLFWVLGYFGIL